MAYCDLLTFRTTFPEEELVTTVSFNCRLLREEMDPDQGGDAELAKLLEDAITFEQTEDAAASEDHFFEVTLSGLGEAPEPLKRNCSPRIRGDEDGSSGESSLESLES